MIWANASALAWIQPVPVDDEDRGGARLGGRAR